MSLVLASLISLALTAGPADLPDWNKWHDRSSHKVSFVRVNGVRLEVLDWGGTGEALVFCNGWEDNAHCFDDIAPKFTDRFHVLAFTRRGFGKSDHPTAGYEAETMAEEIVGFLDAMHLRSANLVGHSAGGALISLVAAHHPERVHKLVFFDGTYDYTSPIRAQFLRALGPYLSEPAGDGTLSLAEYRRQYRATYVGGMPPKPFWSDALENELHDFIRVDGRGRVWFTTPAAESAKFATAWMASVHKGPLPWEMIKAPALAFMCYSGMESFGYDLLDRTAKAKFAAGYTNYYLPYVSASMHRFEQLVKNGQVVTLMDTHHYCYVQRLHEVVSRMRAFLAE